VSVQGVITRDTKKPIADLLNAAADQYNLDAVELLGGAIAESTLDERSAREGIFPDVSFGLFHPSVKWIDPLRVPGLTLDSNTPLTVADTQRNRAIVRAYFWDAARAIAYVAPDYARLRARWGDPVESWARYNKPNLPSEQNPNAANYKRALERAEQYRATEAPMTVGSKVDESIWRAFDATIPLNPDSAIYKKWRELRNQGTYLGAPVSGEVQTDVGVQQPFVSGAVLNWTPEGGAVLANG
jgi:hypothetical protein